MPAATGPRTKRWKPCGVLSGRRGTRRRRASGRGSSRRPPPCCTAAAAIATARECWARPRSTSSPARSVPTWSSGLCAALYAGRGMLKALTIERGAPGGELLNTDVIEDYIGFESIKGWELAQKMTAHAKKFGAEIVTDTVERIRKADDGWFEVATARGAVYRAPAVILTAGG